MSTKTKRHPLAIAWDEWLASDEGRSCADRGTLTPAPVYLENRLHRAFDAGARPFDEVVAALEAIREVAQPIIRDPENTNTFASWAAQVSSKALAAVKNDSGDEAK